MLRGIAEAAPQLRSGEPSGSAAGWTPDRVRFGYNGPAMLVACLTLTILSSVILLAAIRGRRVDDQPLCRRCGYDLTGRAGDRCPECGRDLTRPRAVRVGHRRRRWGVASVAAALLAASLLYPFRSMYVALNQVRWVEHAPVWWLTRDLTRTGTRQIAALAELTRRLRAGGLSQPQVDAVADRCLVVQGNPAVVWDTAWGEFVETAASEKRLDTGRWERYGRQAFGAMLTVPKHLLDDRSYMLFKITPTSARTSVRVLHAAVVVTAAVDRLTPIVWGRREAYVCASNWTFTVSELASQVSLAEPLPAGEHLLAVSIRVTVAAPDWMPLSSDPRYSPPPTLKCDLFLKHALLVVPSVPDPDRINAAALVYLMDAALDVCQVRTDEFGRRQLVCHMTAVPAPVAFDVFVSPGIDGEPTWVGGFFCLQGQSTGVAFDLSPRQTTAGTLDVSLRPSNSMHPAALDVDPVWGGEIVRHRVPVDGPATRPT